MMANPGKKVGAVVLAAGMSRRMGQAKLILPYKDSTVLGTVLKVLHSAGITPLVSVIGGSKEAVEQVITALPFDVTIAHNPYPDKTEMLDSLRYGIKQLPADLDALLIVLGDQPQILGSTVSGLVQEYIDTERELIIPSYQMRRGHPWLVGRKYWDELVGMNPDHTMRDFLRAHSAAIHYLVVDTPTIISDLDTPEDYKHLTGKEIQG